MVYYDMLFPVRDCLRWSSSSAALAPLLVLPGLTVVMRLTWRVLLEFVMQSGSDDRCLQPLSPEVAPKMDVVLLCLLTPQRC